MRKLIATEYLTLDGVMQDPGGGNWSFPFWNDEAAKFKYDLVTRVDGSKFSEFWLDTVLRQPPNR
jgi:hypothetical protein